MHAVDMDRYFMKIIRYTLIHLKQKENILI